MRANYKFGSLPDVYRKRYSFPVKFRHSTSAPIGKFVPLPPLEVLPGSTFKINMGDLVQLTSTFIRPIMDDVFIDTFAFFVPLRLAYDKLENVFGDPRPSAYTDPEFATIPTIPESVPNSEHFTVMKSGVLDHLGLPTYGELKADTYSILKPRCVPLCWNEYFRNQNVDQETYVNTGEVVASEAPNNNSWGPNNYMGGLPPISRFNDYFSTMMLAPQKGPAVRIPGFVQDMPVFATGDFHYNLPSNKASIVYSSDDNLGGRSVGFTSVVGNYRLSPSSTPVGGFDSGIEYTPINLNANASDVADATINNLRTAFQIQKYYERDAIFGSRYREYLYGAFGVEVDEATLQVPQFLAHGHHRLDITSVASTSDAVSGDAQSYPVGQFAGSSKTLNIDTLHFTRSFTEHGYIMFFFAIRYKHLYSQGIHKSWRRLNRNDFYDPLFANLSQQAVMLDEVFGEEVTGGGDPTSVVIGYQDAWSEYRTFQNSVSGQMRPDPSSDGIGKYWSLADFYTSAPTLLDLVHETGEPWKRVLSVDPDVQDPFIIDFEWRGILSMVVPYNSIPGYADHH